MACTVASGSAAPDSVVAVEFPEAHDLPDLLGQAMQSAQAVENTLPNRRVGRPGPRAHQIR
jgi:hypothetical protein